MTLGDTFYVFVYGTLKRGFPNYDESLLGKSFVGDCKTIERYPLVVANKYYSPVLIDEKGEGQLVQGELFKVSQEVLSILDKMEGVDQDWGYRRIQIDVALNADKVVSAHTYVKKRHELTAIHSTSLSTYEIDERYVHPSER